MYHSIPLTPPLLPPFNNTLCQDKIHKLPGPKVSKCWSKQKWLIVDEEGARWTILHHRKAMEKSADGLIWYSKDMSPVDLEELVAEETKEKGQDVEVEEGGWEIVDAEDISEGYVVVK